MALESQSRRTIITIAAIAMISLMLSLLFDIDLPCERASNTKTRTPLPEPRREGMVSVEAAIADRRSRREYGSGALSMAELGQLLWAAQGITARSSGFRAAPSAGATYPLEVYVVVGEPGVDGLETGIYLYDPESHSLSLVRSGDHQQDLREAALDQEWIERGAIDLAICAVDERTNKRYGERGQRRYVPMEAGHAGENIYLQAEALDLAVVSVGAFQDDRVQTILDAPETQRPLSIYPVGKRPD